MNDTQVTDDQHEEHADDDQYEEPGPRGAAAVFGPTINAIFAPQAAFDALVARPVLAVWPVIWVTLSAIVLGVLNTDVTRQVFRISIIESMQRRGQELDPDQLRPMLEGMDKWAPIIAPAQNLFLLLFVVVIAVFFWIAASLAGGSTSFARAFGVAAIGAVIMPLLGLAFVTMMWQMDPPVFRRMTEFVEATPSLSLALFFGGADTSMFWRTILAGVSVFNVWWIYVSAIGCRTLLEIKSGAAWGVPVAIWLITTLIGAGLASLNG